MSEPRKIYWDSSCFICFLNPAERTRREICEDILHHAQNGGVEIWTSTWTIVEVIRPKKPGSQALKLSPIQIYKIQGMFDWPFLKKIYLDERVAREAVKLARDCGLRPGDAVHAASAILKKLDVLQRWDRDFDRIKQLITVEEPQHITKQGELIPGRRKEIGPAPDEDSNAPQAAQDKK